MIEIEFNDSEEFLSKMGIKVLHDKEFEKVCPDVVFYQDGPKYWAELCKKDNGKFAIVDLRKIQ